MNMEEFSIKRYDMKKVPPHLRPVVELLILGEDLFSSDFDNEGNLTELAGSIVHAVHEHDIPDDWEPRTIEHFEQGDV